MKAYYRDSHCVIYHGDCREILPQLCAEAAIVTDPQYQLANGKKANVKGRSTGRGTNLLKGTLTIQRDYLDFKGDDRPFEPAQFIRPKRTILWGANHYASRLPDSTSWLVWDKRDGIASDDNSDAELAWTNLGGPTRLYRHLWRGICRAGAENIASSGNKLHPFQKPLALMLWCIQMIPFQLQIIDPFMGSGTTLRAAKDLGRMVVGIEIEEAHCEIAALRLGQEVLAL